MPADSSASSGKCAGRVLYCILEHAFSAGGLHRKKRKPTIMVPKIPWQPLVRINGNWFWPYLLHSSADPEYPCYEFRTSYYCIVRFCLNKLSPGRGILERSSPGRNGSLTRDLRSCVFINFVHCNPSFESWCILKDTVF